MLTLQGNMWVTQSNLYTQGKKSSFRDIKLSVWGPNFQLFPKFRRFSQTFLWTLYHFKPHKRHAFVFLDEVKIIRLMREITRMEYH